jgi:hypothetical protein
LQTKKKTHHPLSFSFQKKLLSNKILQLQKEEEEKQTIKAFILFVKLLLLSKNTLTNPNLIYQTFLQLKKNVFREKRRDFV